MELPATPGRFSAHLTNADLAVCLLSNHRMERTCTRVKHEDDSWKTEEHRHRRITCASDIKHRVRTACTSGIKHHVRIAYTSAIKHM